MEPSLQDKFAPKNACFGCGPANPQGLRLKSHVSADWETSGAVTCEWTPAPQYEAFTGMLNGGIIGALLDCHSNWTAAHFLMRQAGASEPPCTVTADFHVKLTAPTPSNEPVSLRARVVESTDRKAIVDAELLSGGNVTATCRGTFVAVREGHPAYHRW
jgi:acyl-coenzyme A thioesterase PaaI-like protein